MTAAEVKDDDDDDDNDDDDDEAAAVVAAPCAKVEASRLDEGQLLTLGWLLSLLPKPCSTRARFVPLGLKGLVPDADGSRSAACRLMGWCRVSHTGDSTR